MHVLGTVPVDTAREEETKRLRMIIKIRATFDFVLPCFQYSVYVRAIQTLMQYHQLGGACVSRGKSSRGHNCCLPEVLVGEIPHPHKVKVLINKDGCRGYAV